MTPPTKEWTKKVKFAYKNNLNARIPYEDKMNNTEQNILKGCEKIDNHSRRTCGVSSNNPLCLEDGIWYCSECKKLLEGYKLAQKELKENILKELNKINSTNPDANAIISRGEIIRIIKEL